MACHAWHHHFVYAIRNLLYISGQKKIYNCHFYLFQEVWGFYQFNNCLHLHFPFFRLYFCSDPFPHIQGGELRDGGPPEVPRLRGRKYLRIIPSTWYYRVVQGYLTLYQYSIGISGFHYIGFYIPCYVCVVLHMRKLRGHTRILRS